METNNGFALESSHEGNQTCLPYQAPQLIELGSIQSLVQASGGTGADGGVGFPDCTHS